jgi:hypothetical protein
MVNGAINASASNGAGGWYIGGSFTLVGGVARDQLAHIRANGTVSDWDPNANSTVNAIAVSWEHHLCGWRIHNLKW